MMKIKSPEQQIIESGLFDAEFLLQQNSRLADLRASLVEAYLKDPAYWELSTNPLFSGSYYLSLNSDVRAAQINPLFHYLKNGGVEGRDPHQLFDARFYLENYLSGDNSTNPLIHFLTIGADRGNLPYAGFDYDLYRELVSAKIPNRNILADFVVNYHLENRQRFVKELVRKTLAGNERSRLHAETTKLRFSAAAEGVGICDVVIPIKNSIHWAARSLDSILRTDNRELVGKIILVDDGSSDSSRILMEKLTQKDPRIELYKNTNCPGFAGACNFGFSMTTAPYVLFQNSDCLVAPSTIAKLINAFRSDSETGLACPLSNNAANLSIPLVEGSSYVVMDRALEEHAEGSAHRYPEVCSIVGHCLMVSRTCYTCVNGMDESFGLGYGEETDLHMRARAAGFLGVVATDAYVYHFAGGTFRYVEARESLLRSNFNRFMAMWGADFTCFNRTVSPAFDRFRLGKEIEESFSKNSFDVLFVLPGLTSGVGGIQVVIDLCNYLIISGMDARVLILGQLNSQLLLDYPEALYFRPYHTETENEFLTDFRAFPQIVIPTLFATAPAAFKFADLRKARMINFVQGYEFYFDNGLHYERVRESYLLAEAAITTSQWLASQVERHAPGVKIWQLPLGFDQNTFFPTLSQMQHDKSKRIRIAMVIRGAPDKGQFVLRDLCDLLVRLCKDISLTIFIPQDYQFDSPWIEDQATIVVKIPVDRVSIGNYLRESDIFIDASMHEGYGLFPLEAMASGACVIASDSGGIGQFLRDQENSIIVSEVNKPERYFEAVQKLIRNPALLARLREAGLATAEAYYEADCFHRYWHYLDRQLSPSQ